MKFFDGVITISGVNFLAFSIFAVGFLGYLLGRINIKGIKLGTAGTFIIALIYGAIFSKHIKSTISQDYKNEKVDISSNALKIIENFGLIFFISTVGFISGPTFFKNLKKNYKSYIVIGLLIVLTGSLITVACFYIGKPFEKDQKEFVAMIIGIFAGALTSTPAFSSAKASAGPDYESAVTVGYGIAYFFGVIGVVLFVQIVPKIMRANMEVEKALIIHIETTKEIEYEKLPTFHLDPFGFCLISFSAIIGIFIGAIRIPLSNKGLDGSTFSLTTTGGVLLTSLVIGHFGRICNLSLTIEKRVLEILRELGLFLFLIGAGISGGSKFIEFFKGIYFAYGIFITLLPMIFGFIFAKYVLKLCLLNNLGSITGGMTSTPALGTLINAAGTDEIVGSYAATYPISLIAIVISSQFLILLLK